VIKIGQFTTPNNSTIIFAAKLALHLRNQKSEALLTLQKRYCNPPASGRRVVFTESLLLLFALGKISFDLESDRIIFNENIKN
jgi:hypothetical protein